MPVEGINGILNVESAALHAPQVGVANTNPQHILSVGSNLYVSGDSPDVLTVDGNVVCEGVKVGLIEITPSYDLEAVANVGNSTSNTIQFTNPDTGIVTTGNVSVGKDLNVTGNLNVLGTTTTIDTENLRVKDPIIELGKDNAGSLVDLGLVMTRPSGSSNVAVIFDESADTLEIGYTQNNASDTDIAMRTAAIEPLSVNVNGNVSVGKELNVTGNVAVGTNKLFVDTVGGTVGIGSTLIDITDNTLSGAGNGLYIHNPVQGGHLLTLGTQRPWVFEQGLSDASTELCLRSLNSGKKFNIQSPDHSNVMTVVATNGGGNVGIGTTSPETTLQLHKEFDADTLKNAAQIKFSTNNSSNNSWDVGSIRGAVSLNAGGSSNFPGGLVFATKSPGSVGADLTDKMVIDANGNVGIGTTNPSASLHVQGGQSIFGSNGGASGIVINDIPEARWKISTGGYALSFYKHNSTSDEYSTWSEKVRIDSNGNVGIGVTNPGAILSVSGSENTDSTIAMSVDKWKTKTWYGGAPDNSTLNIIIFDRSGRGSGNGGEIAGEVTVIVHRDGLNQQRAYAKYHVNYTHWYGTTWYGTNNELHNYNLADVTNISIQSSNSNGTIYVSIEAPNISSPGQYYIKFEGPIYKP
jgi:hypothetical protein